MMDMLELRLSDVTFLNKNVLSQLTQRMFEKQRTQYLMKLALTGINLGNDKMVKELCDLLASRRNL